MSTISRVTADTLDELIAGETLLFRDDAGQYDRHADVTWPARLGRERYGALLHDPDWLMLLAGPDPAIGAEPSEPQKSCAHLVAYISGPAPTQLCKVAVLHSLYVSIDRRSGGIGSALIREFFLWARERDAPHAAVSAYYYNEGAQRFYRRHGFLPQSTSFNIEL